MPSEREMIDRMQKVAEEVVGLFNAYGMSAMNCASVAATVLGVAIGQLPEGVRERVLDGQFEVLRQVALGR